MARITAGVGCSHVPAIGVAMDSGITEQPYWEPGCCQTNENSHRIACAALIYALNSWRHSVRAAVRLSLKLSRE